MRMKLPKRRVHLFCCFCIMIACFGCVVWEKKTQRAMFSLLEGRIVLDAGHGGWDPGRTGTLGKNEKDLNLAVTEKLAIYLEQGGATVILTRKKDEALGKEKRTDMAERKRIVNESDADLLISVHQNAFPSAKAQGAQVFYHQGSEKGKCLAECVQESLRIRLDEKNHREAKENNNYYILRKTEIPAVIVECGFLSNQEEETLLNNEDYQEKLAWAIYCGILDYFQKSGII